MGLPPQALPSHESLIPSLLLFSSLSLASLTNGLPHRPPTGKTTLALAIKEALGKNISYISHDNYYKDISHLSMEERASHNFDHPDSLDTDLMYEHVQQLKQGQSVDIPTYDFATHSRTKETVHVDAQSIILIEGILIYTHDNLKDVIDVKIFVDTDDDIRLIRRMERDINERGRTAKSVIDQYVPSPAVTAITATAAKRHRGTPQAPRSTFPALPRSRAPPPPTRYMRTVRPMHNKFVEPSKAHADVIIPVGLNSVALDMIISRLRFHAAV